MDNTNLIYLDVCVLCRPFDNQQYLRIRMESEAVNLILSNIKQGKFRLLVSPVHIIEIDAISDNYECIHLRTLLEKYGEMVKVDMSKTRARAEELFQKGFGLADAAHIAFAEESNAPFITCDDQILNKCLKEKMGIWCTNPVIFCEKEKLR